MRGIRNELTAPRHSATSPAQPAACRPCRESATQGYVGGLDMVSVRVAHARLMGGTAAILACGFHAAAAQESGIPAIALAPVQLEAPPPATDETPTPPENQPTQHLLVQHRPQPAPRATDRH